MNFKITKDITNGINLVHLHDPKQSVKISIAPDYGAMLHAFEVSVDNRPFNIINNYSSEENIKETLTNSYKSSKLSPFPCRIKNAQYTLNGQLYEFPNKFRDGTAIHGLLFNKKFTLTAEVATAFMASVDFSYSYKAEDPGFPFRYTCIIRYTLFPDNVLQLQTILVNDDTITIPLGDGWHPYFSLDAPVDNCTLQFAADGMLEFDDQLIPTGQTHPFSAFNEERLLGETKLDNCFVVDRTTGQPGCIFRNPENGLSIEFSADENYPFLQIYTPDDRKSIAIENLSAAPDCFNNKIGLLLLEPGTQKSLTLHYQVKTR
jgi:aldose 1-epimerase